MKADSIHLFDFLENGKTIFEIPVFQRNYEWGEQQCGQLFKDLTAAFNNDQDHFIGAIVYVAETGPKMSHIYRIIDGQQRLMSLTLLLKALSDVDDQNREEIQEQYLANKYLDENNHLKLKPVDHDVEAYEAVMHGRLNQFKAPSKVIENYRFFKEQIKNSNLSSSQLYEAMNHFDMVYIELTNNPGEENPQVIFESLNSTGISLSSSDLVRNFLLMKLDSASQDRLYKEYWSKMEQIFTTNTFAEFIRHYLIMKIHRVMNMDSVYGFYKKFYYDRRLNSNDALADLYGFANYYDQMLKAQTDSPKLNHILDHINIMQSRAVYPYFMMLLSMRSKGKLEWQDVIELAHMMESYLFRLKVCRHSTSGVSRIVGALCNKERANGDLRGREIQFLRNNFLDDREVSDSLAEVNLYSQRNNLAKLALVVLEENRTKETIDFDNAQIEHIMPQHLTSDWRIQVPNADKVNEQLGGTIGNLALTKYNQEMGNKTFSEKKTYYRESNISITREISEKYDTWNRDTINQRTKELANELINIFPKPDVKKVKSEELAGEHAIDDSVDITGRKPIKLTIGDKDYSVDSWRRMLIAFLNYIWNKDSLNYEKIKNDGFVGKMLFQNEQSPERLENGAPVETNFSASVILAIISKISEICAITSEVKYTVS